MQSMRELRAMPHDTDVVLHLLRSAIGAIPAHKEALASLGLLARRPGNGRHVSSGHVGSAVRHTWQSALASPTTQQLTKYMFVDPGDEVLAALDAEADMNVEHLRTSIGEPAIRVPITDRQAIRIESQPDGFGMIWPTDVDVVTAIGLALSVLPKPTDGDEAMIMQASGTAKTFPTKQIFDVLSNASEAVSVACIDIGPASFTWALGGGNGNKPDRRISFGDDYYARATVESLLAETAVLPDDATLSELLDVADETLYSHLPPAPQS
jgi:hypothetical protein